MMEAKCAGDVKKGPQAKEHRWPPKAEKGKEMDSPKKTP